MLIKSLITSTLLLFTSLTMAQQPSPPKVLDGDYVLELTIGGKVFVDRMTLQGKNGPMKLNEFQDEIIGTMEVPGMFTSPITGSGSCTPLKTICELEFSIVANENGKLFKVSYTATVNEEAYHNYQKDKGPLVITGRATLEDGSILGDYSATKL